MTPVQEGQTRLHFIHSSVAHRVLQILRSFMHHRNLLILIRFTYTSETWVLRKKDEALISTWERKVLRKMFGPVNERNVWRIRSNHELRCMYQDLDLVTAIRKSRLKWLGHV
jgi:hypothetical protein